MCRVLHLPPRVRHIEMTHNLTSGLGVALNMLFTNTPRRHLVELSAAIGRTTLRTRNFIATFPLCARIASGNRHRSLKLLGRH